MDTPPARYREGAMRRALLLVAVLGACKGKTSGEAPPPLVKKDAGVVVQKPVDMAQAKVTLDCLFTRARYPRDVLQVLAESAPAPVVRMAALAGIDRARKDGETPAQMVIADAIEVFTRIDDLDGLRAMFALVDVIPGARPNVFNHEAPARARAGLSVKPEDFAGDKAAIVRELALAGNLPAATKMFGELQQKDIDDNYEQEPYLGALVALGKVADAKALIAKQKPEDRFKMTYVWLDVALRQRAPLADGLAVALAELAVASEKSLIWFSERKLLERAIRAGRAAELAPLYNALLPKLLSDGKHGGLSDLPWAFAVASGDAAAAKRLAAEPALASHIAVRTAPLDAALAAAAPENKRFPLEDLVRIWARSIADGADPTFGARLAAAVCPKPTPPRAPATPAVTGLTLTVAEKARKQQFECANHDVIVRLLDGKKVIGEEILAGECHGPCTAAEQREGRARLAEIEKAIEDGTASESETDYNFTDCMFSGPNVGRIDKLGDRQVALIANHYIGAHDIDKDSYQLALEVCGQLHLTGLFGGMYAGSWGLDELHVRERDGIIHVEVDTDRWHGAVFRLTLPACPGTPEEQSFETE